MSRWTARVAPLGVKSSDGRLLEPDGRWDFYGPVPLVTIGGPRRRVGTVETITVASGAIWASGTADDPHVADLMRSRELRPALEFGEQTRYQVDEGEGALVATVRYKSGTVAAIAVVGKPAWPDDVWFEVEPEGTSP